MTDEPIEEEPKKKLKATERKRLIRQRMRDNFTAAGCELLDLKAGPQFYTAVRAPDLDFNIAAIYGSRIGASLWIKEEVHERLQVKHREEYAKFADVVDVDLFRRGFAWAIHFRDPFEEQDLIDLVCTVSLQWGRREEKRKQDVADAKVAEELAKIERENKRRERMDAKRKDWRSRKGTTEEPEESLPIGGHLGK